MQPEITARPADPDGEYPDHLFDLYAGEVWFAYANSDEAVMWVKRELNDEYRRDH